MTARFCPAFPARACLAVGLLAFGAGCSLLDSDFEGAVTLDFEVLATGRDYDDIEVFDPNDDEDFANNRDRIQDGTIDSMEFTIVNVQPSPTNEATFVFGRADVRLADDPNAPWIEGVSAWEGIEVFEGNRFFVDVPADQQEQITRLIFDTDAAGERRLEVRVTGGADRGPVNFQIRVRLNIVFVARPI